MIFIPFIINWVTIKIFLTFVYNWIDFSYCFFFREQEPRFITNGICNSFMTLVFSYFFIVMFFQNLEVLNFRSAIFKIQTHHSLHISAFSFFYFIFFNKSISFEFFLMHPFEPLIPSQFLYFKFYHWKRNNGTESKEQISFIRRFILVCWRKSFLLLKKYKISVRFSKMDIFFAVFSSDLLT